MHEQASELTPELLDCTAGSTFGRWEFLLVSMELDEEGLQDLELLSREGLQDEQIQCIEDLVWEAPWPPSLEGEILFRQPFPPPG